MIIGERLRTLREALNLSRVDIEKRTGSPRCYIPRVEHGHTVPSVETLEKLALGLEVPLYRFFYDGADPKTPEMAKSAKKMPKRAAKLWGSNGKDSRLLTQFCRIFSCMNDNDRLLLLHMARRLSNQRGSA